MLRRFEYWDELIDACRSGYLEPTRLSAEQGKLHANLGLALYCRGNVAEADSELAALRELRDKQLALRQLARDEAARRPEVERAGAPVGVDKQFNRPLAALESQIAQLESYRRIATGFFLSRSRLIVYLALLTVAEGVAYWFLRRRMERALLSVVASVVAGVWLFWCHLALVNMAADSTNVDFAFVTRKQLEAGDFDQAEWSARQFAQERPGQVRPQANLVEVLYRAGKKDDAREEFETLRDLAGTADLDAPPLARLAPLARELGYPTDWRRPETINTALAGRRSLPSLGPFLWRPSKAPDWKLKDAEGRTRELGEFRGKPVLLIFFLGRSCLHCQRQLAAFAKKRAEFLGSGLALIAISTDDRQAIKKSLADWATPFPFLMLADPRLDAFRAYRAYDDFEQIALHATVLVDSDGFIRWHDEGAEPFMDVEFLLSEAKRLLARPVAPPE